MDIRNKIDQELLYMVRVANLSRIVNCIVWIKDFFVNKEKIVSQLDEGELVAMYPFIGAIGITASQEKVSPIPVTMPTILLFSTRISATSHCKTSRFSWRSIVCFISV